MTEDNITTSMLRSLGATQDKEDIENLEDIQSKTRNTKHEIRNKFK